MMRFGQGASGKSLGIQRVGACLPIQPVLPKGRRYYRQGEPEFGALVRQVAQANLSLPAAIRREDFARLTYAIASVGASAGNSLGVVYLPHPAETGRSRRGANGMVVTAYPLRSAKAQWIGRATPER
jgi:hypothetical protein